MNFSPYMPAGYFKKKLNQPLNINKPSAILTQPKPMIASKQQQRPCTIKKKFSRNTSSKMQHQNRKFSTQLTCYQKRPQITASSFILYDSLKNISVSNRAFQQREIASLTKIMTVVVALEFISRHQLEKDLMVRVSSSSSALGGTSARLPQGLFVKLYDLLYGAMLPSGNDAAFLLAEVLGLLMFYENIKPQQKQYTDIESVDLSFYDNTITFINRFIKEMNLKAKRLKMSKTNFANPHGLGNALNISTAHDVMILAKYAVTNEDFRQIMSTKQFQCEFYDDDMEIFDSRVWKNTNKLIDQGWEGIKTGHTPSAGSCLSSVKDGVFIVVLNCTTMEKRFQDTVEIFTWYQENGKNPQKSEDLKQQQKQTQINSNLSPQ